MDPTKYGPANHKFQILLSATLLPYRHVVSKYTVQYCTNTFITLFLTYFYLKKFFIKSKAVPTTVFTTLYMYCTLHNTCEKSALFDHQSRHKTSGTETTTWQMFLGC